MPEQFKQLSNKLEELVDIHGLEYVVWVLSHVCDDKSTHVKTNWQDDDLARSWYRDAQELKKVQLKLNN